MRIMKENMRAGNLPANMKKNRVLQIIPCKALTIVHTHGISSNMSTDHWHIYMKLNRKEKSQRNNHETFDL